MCVACSAECDIYNNRNLLLELRSALFWDITQGMTVIPFRRFGKTYRSIFKGFQGTSWLLKMGPIICPETWVRNYRHTLRNNPEERQSHLLRGGSLKLRIVFGIFLVRGFLYTRCKKIGPHTHVLIATWEVGRHLDPNYGGRGQNLISYKWLGYTQGPRGALFLSLLTREARHLARACWQSGLVPTICQIKEHVSGTT